MQFFKAGLSGIASTNGKQLFEYSINSIRNIMSSFEHSGGHLFGNQLTDVTALIKLQKNMVEGSEQAAKYIIPFHLVDAMRALETFKLIKNSTLQLEVSQLKSAWDVLKLQADAQDRDEILAKFQGRIDKNLQDRVANAQTTSPPRVSAKAASGNSQVSERDLERQRTLA